MKRVACLNTLLTSPEDPKASEKLMDLFNSVRLYNKEQRVNGVVLVSDNALLQILEGESHVLAELIYRFSRDTWTKDTSVILNTDIDVPLFNNWRLKFVKSSTAKNDQYLRKIHKAIVADINVTTPQDERRLALFFSSSLLYASLKKVPEAAEEKEDGQNTFVNKRLSLAAWPKPSQIKPSPEIFKLCSLLSRREAMYETLKQLDLFESAAHLDNCLYLLDGFGLLISATVKEAIVDNASDDKVIVDKTVIDNELPSNRKPQIALVTSNTKPMKKDNPSDRFSQVLRKFISQTKRTRM
ncbi:MAG: BLUF domain-containing protein [Cellvibrionales bacterium]|nr:BLUF domain-containing protein [Cellvibrionales bacterium]